ncbi:hypothetical protein NQ176_g4831 [Zarea fungicola]|uniref:Uncharacterized protein n=1 Tax=Zarea fungicola TaxID=93591 RepID=A0ACC1NCE1_9HYPO|nr:hypothetical protein NQ176_g4831 [Lecanicillium fungicola]
MLPSQEIFYCMLESIVNINTQEGIVLAASNHAIVQCGSLCVALTLALLDDSKLGDALSEDNLPGLLSLSSVAGKVLRLICQKGRKNLLLKKPVLRVLPAVEGATAMLQQLVREGETPNSNIDQEVLQVVAEHHDPQTLELFIKHSPDSCKVKVLLRAAILNERHCYTMPLVVMKFAQEAIKYDEELQVDLLKSIDPSSPQSKATLDTLLMLSPHTDLVKRLLIRFVMEWVQYDRDEDGENSERLRAILDRVEYAGIVDHSLLKIAVGKCTAEIVEIVLEYSTGQSIAAEEFLAAAAENMSSGKSVMEFILQKYKAEAVITLRVVLVAAKCDYNGVLWLLLETRPDQVKVTADVLSYLYTAKSFETLLRLRSDEVAPIASAALHMMARGHAWSIPGILGCFPLTWFQPTEELVLDVLEDTLWSVGNLSILINTFGDQIIITETILASAASSLKGEELLRMLRVWRPSEFEITSWVVEKAATNGSHALRNLVKNAGGKLVVDEKTWKLAAFRDSIKRDSLEHLEQLWTEEPVVEVTDQRGRTSLINAVRGRASVEIVRFLLDVTGADLNATDPLGRSALHYAVQGSNLELVQTLVVAGADPQAADVDGETPVSLVEKRRLMNNSNIDCDMLLLILNDEWYAGFLANFFGGEEKLNLPPEEVNVTPVEENLTPEEVKLAPEGVNWAWKWMLWMLIRILDWMPWVNVWIDRVWR